MHALEFLRKSTARQARPIYAVYGDDAFLRSEAIARIARDALGPDADDDIHRVPGDGTSLADVLDEVCTLPFLSARRIVVVEDADKFVTAHRKELERYAESPSDSGTLVLAVKAWTSSTKLAKLVEKAGLSVECKTPREGDLPDWLAGIARDRFDTALEPDAARLLVELIGPEVGLLVSEIEKLSTYVGEKAKIRRDDVSRMVGAGRVETIWKTLDAATTGKGRDALALLDQLLASGEHPVGLLAAMSASLRKLHHAGSLRRARRELGEACQAAGIPTFPSALEQTKRQHAHLGPSRVDSLPNLLLHADLDLKGSSALPPRAILERLLIRLSCPRQD